MSETKQTGREVVEAAMLEAGIIFNPHVASRATVDELQSSFALFKRNRSPYASIIIMIDESDYDNVNVNLLIRGLYCNVGYGYEPFFVFSSIGKAIEAYNRLINSSINCDLRITAE